MNQKLIMTVPVNTSTSVATPNGRISFLRYDPQDESIPQPLIIYLHGANCRSETQDTTTVGIIEASTSGVPYYSNAAHPTTGGIFPAYPDPTGTMREFYILAPQLWGVPNASSPPGNTLWNNTYLNYMFSYAQNPANGMNVDWGRVYLCGYSLGGGGTLSALSYPENTARIAAAAVYAPGYFVAKDNDGLAGYATIAKSGIPIYWAHGCGDSVTNNTSNGSETWTSGIRRYSPLCDPKYHRWYSNSHNQQHRLFTTLKGSEYSQASGPGSTSLDTVTEITEKHKMVISLYEWFLLTNKADRINPKYV